MCAQFGSPPEHLNPVLHLPPRGCNGSSIFPGPTAPHEQRPSGLADHKSDGSKSRSLGQHGIFNASGTPIQIGRHQASHLASSPLRAGYGPATHQADQDQRSNAQTF
ncbi:hypothetical protein ACLOJK_034246 [Asimina triloba]